MIKTDCVVKEVRVPQYFRYLLGAVRGFTTGFVAGSVSVSKLHLVKERTKESVDYTIRKQ